MVAVVSDDPSRGEPGSAFTPIPVELGWNGAPRLHVVEERARRSAPQVSIAQMPRQRQAATMVCIART